MIDDSKKHRAISLFLRGLKYEEIHSRLSISMGEVSKIVNDYRRDNPEYEALQKLAERLPAETDFSQYNQLVESLVELQTQLDCNIEQVPSLMKDKMAVVNEIILLEQKRESASEEISEYERIKQELRSEIQSQHARITQLGQEIRVLNFQKAERQRDLVVLQDALTRGNKWLNS